MKKAAILSVVILLSSLAVTSVVFAQQQTKQTCILGWGEGCVVPYRPPVTPRPPQPEIQIANGVAVDRYYLTTEPVLFVIFRYNYWDTKMYLIMNGDFIRMEQIESRYDWDTNTRMFKYRDESRDVMTLVAQEFSDGISISAVYKNYVITFEPIRYGIQPEPIRETQIAPLMPTFKQMTQNLGIKSGTAAESLISQAKPIADWNEKEK